MEKSDVIALRQRIDGLEARETLRQLMYHYGISQDILFLQTYRKGPEAGREASLAAFRSCFIEDVTLTAILFGESSRPLFKGNSLREWVDFLIAFCMENRISSARHLISNVDIKMTSDTTADLTAASLTAHFQASDFATARRSNLFFSGNYAGKAKKIAGVWRIVEFIVNVDDAQNVVGDYSFGFHPGATTDA